MIIRIMPYPNSRSVGACHLVPEIDRGGELGCHLMASGQLGRAEWQQVACLADGLGSARSRHD